MAQRSNEESNDQDRSRYSGQYDGDRGRRSGQSGPWQSAGDYQAQGMEQNRDNARDDNRMWGGQGRGQQASYTGSQTQDRQQFAGGAEEGYFGHGGREEGYNRGQDHGYGQGQGYGSEGAQGYGDYGGSQTYGGSVNSYGGGSQQQFGRQQGYGAQGQGRGQAGYGQDRGYGAQGYYGGSQSEGRQQGEGHTRGQDRGYGSGLQNRGTSAGYGQGYGQNRGYGQGGQGYGQDDRSQQLQGDYGQQGQQFGRNRDQYARSGLGNETIGQGRIGGYGAIADRDGYGADAYGGPSPGQGFGASSGYGMRGQGYGQQYGYRDDGQSGAQFGGQQQTHRGRGPKNYSRSDERIVEDINERLTHADDVDATDIEVRCESGKVTLEGTVEHRWMKHRAEDIADACAGVRDVENRISVKSSRERGASDDDERQSTQQAQGRNGGSKDSREGKESSSTGGKTGTGGSSQQH